MSVDTSEREGQPQAKWQALTAIQRRVAGVLVEKAKTTPDAYPLSLNAVATGCNQKSNRAPQMNVEPDDAEEALEQLRSMGAVGEVQGGGRVPKYRHYMKEWLGVDGGELAVMAELLLRGPQTVGELRTRAARMASGQIPDLHALRPLLRRLMDAGLVEAMTPDGRGQVVTHTLYTPPELERVRQKHGGSATTTGSLSEPAASSRAAASTDLDSRLSEPTSVASPASRDAVDQLRDELSQLRAEVNRLRQEVEDVKAHLV